MSKEQKIMANILGIISFVIPILSFYAPVSLTVFAPFMAFMLWFYIGQNKISLKEFLPLVLLCLWGIVSAIWSPLSWHGVRTSLTVLLFIGIIIIIISAKTDKELMKKVGYCLLFGLIFAFIVSWADFYFKIALISRIRGYPLEAKEDFLWSFNVLDRGFAISSILLWPALGFLLQRKKYFLTVLLFSSAFVSIFTGFAGVAKLILVSCLASFVIILFMQSKIYTVIINRIIVVSFIFMVPALITLPSPQIIWDQVRGNMPTSILYRLVIWDYAEGYIKEKPILGYGIEASRFIGSKADIVKINFDNIPGNPNNVDVKVTQAMPLHPHNAAVQIWLELGIVGIFLAGWFLWLVGSKISAIDNNILRATMTSTFVAVYAVEMVSVGVWQSWWLATVGLVVFFLLVVERGASSVKNN